MRIRGRAILACLLLAGVISAPAAATISPYVRLDAGGSQLRMADGNKLIRDNAASLRAAGYPADFHTIGTAYGPSGAAGLWLLPGLRIGATWSRIGAKVQNGFHLPGVAYYEHDLDFRMTEIGGEAAVRISRLAGLTIGGNLAQGRAEMVEGFSAEDYLAWSLFYQDDTARLRKTTYGGFIGLDQTNRAGVAGYIVAGYQYRDMGHMPCEITMSDGVSTVQDTGETIRLDYSGVYVKAGIGYDFWH